MLKPVRVTVTFHFYADIPADDAEADGWADNTSTAIEALIDGSDIEGYASASVGIDDIDTTDDV